MLRLAYFTLVAVLGMSLGCSQGPPPPTPEAALSAVQVSANGRDFCGDFGSYSGLTVDSVKIGEFNASAGHWPVRAFIRVNCTSSFPYVSTPVSGNKDFLLAADGFGGWTVRPQR